MDTKKARIATFEKVIEAMTNNLSILCLIGGIILGIINYGYIPKFPINTTKIIEQTISGIIYGTTFWATAITISIIFNKKEKKNEICN